MAFFPYSLLGSPEIAEGNNTAGDVHFAASVLLPLMFSTGLGATLILAHSKKASSAPSTVFLPVIRSHPSQGG